MAAFRLKPGSARNALLFLSLVYLYNHGTVVSAVSASCDLSMRDNYDNVHLLMFVNGNLKWEAQVMPEDPATDQQHQGVIEESNQ